MLTLLLFAACAADPSAPDPAQPSTAKLSRPNAVGVDFRVVVTAPQNTKKLRVWVPVPKSDSAQEVKGSKWRRFRPG